MKHDNDGLTRQIWLFLFREGGYSKQAEVRSRLDGSDLNSLGSSLRNMAEAGMIQKREGPRYGVTRNCKIPRGITLEDVLGVEPMEALVRAERA